MIKYFFISIITNDETKAFILPLWANARKELKAHGLKRSDDGWLFQHNVYYGVINLLGKIGDIEDLTFVEESINKETIMGRHFFRYSDFHHIESLKKLLEIIDTVKKDKERESAISTIDTLDYDWTKEVLKIKA